MPWVNTVHAVSFLRHHEVHPRARYSFHASYCEPIFLEHRGEYGQFSDQRFLFHTRVSEKGDHVHQGLWRQQVHQHEFTGQPNHRSAPIDRGRCIGEYLHEPIENVF